MDVHLERGLVADDDERVAEALEPRLELVAIERLPLDDEDGAVAIARRIEVDGIHPDGRGRNGGRRGHRLARDRAGQPAQQLDEARTARVHDARLAQYLELLRGAGEGLLPVPHEVDEQLAERLGPRGAALGLLRELADD